MSVIAPQPTIVTHRSIVIRAMASSTPAVSIRFTSTTITNPAMISRTLTAMEKKAAFFTLS